ncbi:hypothetical protein CC78DRAFT_351289 [Lojkania enalia]|uniref:Uncharacterized protein n=1 Tax=Lojkania enalia TaxID=147567 RepID=A0A9P4KI49_9PLEO|nr:hypothetical protein CC78DRAFT_351289 [Didymosphaeria enalia]
MPRVICLISDGLIKKLYLKRWQLQLGFFPSLTSPDNDILDLLGLQHDVIIPSHNGILLHIATMFPESSSYLTGTEPVIETCMEPVRELKQERDAWKAIALQYKEAFEAQNRQLREFQDICFATQAELENERTINRFQSLGSGGFREVHTSGLGEVEVQSENNGTNIEQDSSAGMIILDWTPTPMAGTDFQDFERLISRRDVRAALTAIDNRLRGSLSSGARIDGLLLKSAILRECGTDWLFDALAQCSEALELCDRTSGLEDFLPKIQYYKGVCYYRLRMMLQARASFSAVGSNNPFCRKALEYLEACECELETENIEKRRSAFDEQRIITEEYMAILAGNEKIIRRRPATQIRLLPSSKQVRLSLPHRWKLTKSM